MFDKKEKLKRTYNNNNNLLAPELENENKTIPNPLDKATNEKIIKNILKKYSKSMQKLADS